MDFANLSWFGVLDTLRLICGGLAAVFWLAAALIGVRDQIDNFIGDLQRSGRWNTAGAFAACGAFGSDFLIRFFDLAI